MSRRKRASCLSAGRSIARRPSELLRELDAVAVRVEHVQEPHLSGELEHDPDLDAGFPQPARLLLQILDVDVRDGALGLRLALSEPELHRSAPQVRPPLREVDRSLLEADYVAVEAARGIEIANVVPDGRTGAH